MSPELWQSVEEIFLTAIEIADRDERARFLDESCAGNEPLRREVEKLISHDEQAETFLHRPLVEESGLHVFTELIEDDPYIGKKIGKYEIVREIGSGGMGAVYLAQRVDGSFQKQVALKIVKRGMDTKFILRRFKQERQVLALLNHPFIAPLLDGGTTDDGLPFFVMDYVEGETLYQYADKENLSVKQRLKLFTKICQAVEYAHRNRVIHRDLKPSNILIKKDGSPRLLDFGIAKVFNPEFQGDNTIDPTLTAMRMMTPEYASPEQVKGETVSATSDIYSLGVLLYELLTGRRPYRFPSRAPFEIARVICEEEPIPPSAVAEEEKGRKGERENYVNNRISPSPFLPFSSSEISEELERIILKSLRKKPKERYDSAAALAADIENYLDSRPVTAESFAAGGRISEVTSSARRTEKISIAVLPLAVTGAAAGADEEYLGIGLADALVSRLSKLQRFIVRPTSSVLKFQNAAPDPFEAGRALDVEFVVEGTIRRAGARLRVSVKLLSVGENGTRWASNFDEQMTDVLEIEDSISERVAATLVPQLTGDEQRQISKRGTDNPHAFEAYLRGRFFWNQFTPETFPKTLEFFEKAVALDPDYALAHAGIADYYRWAMIFGLYAPKEGGAKARAAVKRALEIDPENAEALVNLGFVKAFTEFDWTEGERLFRRAIEINPSYSLAHELYSALLAGTGRTDEAVGEITLAEKLEPLSVRAVTLTSWHLYQCRRFPEALAKADEAIDMNPLYFLAHVERANILGELGRYDESVAELERARRLAPGFPATYYLQAFAFVALDRREEARQALQNLENLPNSAAVNAYHLGMTHTALGDHEKAFEWFSKGVGEQQEWFVWLATDAKLDVLRGDERFDELLRKTNRQELAGKSDRKADTGNAPPTLAVLPFKILTLGATGSGGEDRFLGIGLADSLISRFSQVRSLVLRPTSSVIRYAEPVDVFSAGSELNAQYVLDGNIRRAGALVRVSVQLFDIRNRSTMWAEKFDENLTDIFDLEDAITERVAVVLIPRLTGEEQRRLARHPTDSPAAYEAYLRGRYHLYQVAPPEFAKAKTYFEQAIRLDADYALAYVGLAEYYFVSTAFADVPSVESLTLGREMARRALEIDDSLGEVWAIYAFFSQADLPEIERILERSIELNPHHSLARVYRSGLYIVQQRYEKAVAEARLAVGLNPLSAFEQSHLTWILYQARRFPEAVAAGRKLLAENPDFSLGYGVFSFILAHVGERDESVETARRGVELNPNSPTLKCSLAICYAKAGETEKARRMLGELEETRKTRPFSPFDLAILHLNLGNRERAFAELRNSVLYRVPQLIWLGSEPELDSIRTDARFPELLQMMQTKRKETNETPT